jgi:ATP phosphoribosyltransferase
MERLSIAIQKSGRLSEKSLQLLKEAGINIPNGGGKLRSVAQNFPLEIIYLRDDDIPEYVADRVVDAGIVGENVILEKGASLNVAEKLGFARCRLAIAVPTTTDYFGVEFLEGKKIATSYPNILRKFLDTKEIKAEIHEISGSVEIAPGIGLSDAVMDIVSTGSTLMSNGLIEVELVMQSEAVLVADKELSKEKTEILENLRFRIQAVQKARNNKYILLNAPDEKLPEIIDLIPGMKSPTIIPLAEEGWSSVHSVLSENEFWDVIDQLKELGAQGILVIPIEKMIV